MTPGPARTFNAMKDIAYFLQPADHPNKLKTQSQSVLRFVTGLQMGFMWEHMDIHAH